MAGLKSTLEAAIETIASTVNVIVFQRNGMQSTGTYEL
jgi:hypothetical protein